MRLDPEKIGDFTLVGAQGQRVPLSLVGSVELRMAAPILRRRDRTPTARGDIAEGLQAAGSSRWSSSPRMYAIWSRLTAPDRPGREAAPAMPFPASTEEST